MTDARWSSSDPGASDSSVKRPKRTAREVKIRAAYTALHDAMRGLITARAAFQTLGEHHLAGRVQAAMNEVPPDTEVDDVLTNGAPTN